MSAKRSGTPGPPAWLPEQLQQLVDSLESIRSDMVGLEATLLEPGRDIHSSYAPSAANLLHYLALRRHDVRQLQEQLAGLGLSSLGRAESHVLGTLDSVLRILSRLADSDREPLPERPGSPIRFNDGKALLERHTEALLGPKPPLRSVRIMVTMPSEAADDYLCIRDILAGGMDCMRVNCAHDDEEHWGRMISNLRRAEREIGRPCRVLMDLGGPKLRTGPIASAEGVIKWRPQRDYLGRVTAPARVWLTPAGQEAPPPLPVDAVLPVPGGWLSRLLEGHVVELEDTRKSIRRVKIVAAVGDSRLGESVQTAYVSSGTPLWIRSRATATGKRNPSREARVGEIPPREQPILLKKGDSLLLTRAQVAGKPAALNRQGRILQQATVPCTLPEVFDSVRPGERIWFDDGKIGGIIRAVSADQIRVEITQARPQGERLLSEKGINLPDTRMRVSALMEKDVSDLRYVAANADLVGLSFVRNVSDIEALRARLAEYGGENLGVVLKIETRRAFEMLPDLLLAAMRSHSFGVMIARGDLAVECGYERLAEVQEEILWLCEAAHVPVIWATQVLETLAKSGMPSRAEITDAAMGERAECVMLNKGPHILDAIRVLDNILQRMEAHQSKKRSMLRRLHWWNKSKATVKP
ncbi:MAG: Pyruvate kinase [Deltaproteobacteria bacterium]|nr:Pyruvate kinase [Deltaproteobacteria bacterium]